MPDDQHTYQLPDFNHNSEIHSKKSESDFKSTVSSKIIDTQTLSSLEDTNSNEKESREELGKLSSFSSMDYVQQESLLTNIEDYSKKVKEDAEKVAFITKQNAKEIETTAQEKLKEAEKIKLDAEQEAKKLLEESKEKCNQIFEESKLEGIKKGIEEGKKEAFTNSEKQLKNLDQLLSELNELRTVLTKQHEHEIIDISLLLAKKIIHTELRVNQEIVKATLHKMLPKFENQGNVNIYIHPSEYEYIEENQLDLQKYIDKDQILRIKADSTITPGFPTIESDFLEIDTNLHKQLKNMEIALQQVTLERTQLFRKTPKSE